MKFKLNLTQVFQLYIIAIMVVILSVTIFVMLFYHREKSRDWINVYIHDPFCSADMYLGRVQGEAQGDEDFNRCFGFNPE